MDEKEKKITIARSNERVIKKERRKRKERKRKCAYESEEERESITIDNIDLNGRAQNKFIKMLIFNLLKKNN